MERSRPATLDNGNHLPRIGGDGNKKAGGTAAKDGYNAKGKNHAKRHPSRISGKQKYKPHLQRRIKRETEKNQQDKSAKREKTKRKKDIRQ